jgi:hypothetical protein
LDSPHQSLTVRNEKYNGSHKPDDFKALEPFFHVIEQGLDGLVDGDQFFDSPTMPLPSM